VVESCLCTIPSVAYLLVYSFQMQMVTNFICLHETFLSSSCYIQAIMWAAYFYCSCWESFRSSWGTNIDIIINRRLPWKTVRVSWINSHPPSLPRQDLPQRCLLISAYFYRAVCLSVLCEFLRLSQRCRGRIPFLQSVTLHHEINDCRNFEGVCFLHLKEPDCGYEFPTE